MSIFRRILIGGLAAGVLDIAYAIGVWALRGVPAERILQSVATGIFGKAAYEGGATTAAWGLVFHFALTTIMATVFVLAYDRLSFLQKRTMLWGLAYGFALYFVMNYGVVPLSAAPMQAPSTLSAFLIALFPHVAFVGPAIVIGAQGGLRPQAPAAA
ncbi:MAG: hypothetical protein EP335_03925 [Alphaproteobacteria bacterium]|nr:MAG: hypothetical protein EP335_03925 [Alphaproteobacteria bacterium]